MSRSCSARSVRTALPLDAGTHQLPSGVVHSSVPSRSERAATLFEIRYCSCSFWRMASFSDPKDSRNVQMPPRPAAYRYRTCTLSWKTAARVAPGTATIDIFRTSKGIFDRTAGLPVSCIGIPANLSCWGPARLTRGQTKLQGRRAHGASCGELPLTGLTDQVDA